MTKRLITAADIREASRSGRKSLHVPADGCIVTPLARDEANALNVLLDEASDTDSPSGDCPTVQPEITTDELTRIVSEMLSKTGAAGEQVESVVREVVAARLEAAAGRPPQDPNRPVGDNKQGIRFIDAQRLLTQDRKFLPINEKMLVANVIGGEKGERLSGGYMVWERATFSRCLESPEIAIVIDGELHLVIDGETVFCRPGDMIYFPEGATVDYHTPSAVKLACVNRV
jgi:ethanolamine utilization protein EutQ